MLVLKGVEISIYPFRQNNNCFLRSLCAVFGNTANKARDLGMCNCRDVVGEGSKKATDPSFSNLKSIKAFRIFQQLQEKLLFHPWLFQSIFQQNVSSSCSVGSLGEMGPLVALDLKASSIMCALGLFDSFRA